MKMRYVSKIQASLKRYQTIHTSRRTTQVLDGSYRSIFKGRSMNFDELREYVPGDEIRDIDWKASARSQKTLVRQYIAEKKHNIMLVMDTSKGMLGDSEGNEEKRELAIMSAGTLAYFVNRSGDYVSATFATDKSIQHFPFKTGLGNIEMILESYHKQVHGENNSNINMPLEYILRNFKRKMILLIVTDLSGISQMTDQNLKRLLVAHDVLVINISDVDFGAGKTYDLQRGKYMPAFFTQDKKLAKKARERKEALQKQCMDKLKQYGIPCVTVDYLDELDKEIIQLLGQHKTM